ncbi:MAG: hypothetical protein ABI763_05455 [Bacteroidota bacterium]
MKLYLFFCFGILSASAQTPVTDSDSTVVSKTLTVEYALGISPAEDMIDGFPKKSFVITDFHYTTTLKGSVPTKGTVENYMGLHGEHQHPFEIFNPKPGMVIRIDHIHVIRKPGGKGEIDIPAILEFFITE